MSKCPVTILIITAAIALAGCSESTSTIAEPSSREEAKQQPLRVKTDPARGRRWELHWGAAHAYDVASGRLVSRIPLTNTSFTAAREACLPDMLLSRSGAVIVSSNAEPVLWRIDPDRLAVERFDIAPDTDKDKDFGFSGLAWSADEKVLHAVSAVSGSRWEIDLDSATARKVASTGPGC